MDKFTLKSKYKLTGDQPEATAKLIRGLEKGLDKQILLGVTGSGKTFTAANVIEKINKPTLVISHNKTLAAQLYSEFKEFFPDNAVRYFVSYYDYYQPEAYIPRTDTYIEKDASINEEIDRLRNAATAALLSRPDTLIVASVSCIYGLGSPEDYVNMKLDFEVGKELNQEKTMKRLLAVQYERNDQAFERGKFRVRGDVLDIFPVYEEKAIRIVFDGNMVESIRDLNPLTGELGKKQDKISVFPAKHFVTPREKLLGAIPEIMKELGIRLKDLKKQGKLLEAQRLEQRTKFDMEMIKETGYCSGIENYSRYLAGRNPGEPPATLLDFFPDDFLMLIDESHMTVPQVRGMYNGDRSRKETLVEHGFRLPSALDNRPLHFSEFKKFMDKSIFISATPGDYEFRTASNHKIGSSDEYYEAVRLASTKHEALNTKQIQSNKSSNKKNVIPTSSPVIPAEAGIQKNVSNLENSNLDIVSDLEIRNSDLKFKGFDWIAEQVIRPTGLLDPEVEVRGTKHQIDDLLNEIQMRVKKKQRVIVTTLTKRMAEDLSEYLQELNIKVTYIHSEINTLERPEILRDLRKGIYDVVIGVNLLREGLDLPEVSLVAILDADKEGFLRGENALIQTIGRAARHSEGKVIMYGDKMTESMKKAISETERRRKIQEEYNKKHGITPTTIKKSIREDIASSKKGKKEEAFDITDMPPDELERMIKEMRKQMVIASNNLEFEQAAKLRDQIRDIREKIESKRIK
ncbi:MAG: excinuclease ABC subunit UvrB [Patescibacteria group bacterium]